MDKLKFLSKIKIIKYYLIIVEINIIKWYNTEKVNMLNKEVIIVNENLDKKILGENIKKRRIELGLSQKKLASNLGISNVSLSQYETGDVNIPLATLNELANILQTTVGKLLGTKEEIEYTTDRQTVLNKAIKNTNTLAIAVEKGIDKVENIFAPILKNSLDDIVILDIDGRTYEETVNHRKIQDDNYIEVIDFFSVGRSYSETTFNPFENINFYTSVNDIEVITNFLLENINSENEELKNNKFDFLVSIIANFYYVNRLKTKNSIYNENKSLGDIYEFLLENDDMVSIFKKMSETDYLNFNELNVLLKYNKNLNNSLEDKIGNLKIPYYYLKLLKLIELGNDKLNKIRKELLKDLYFLDNICGYYNHRRTGKEYEFCKEFLVKTKETNFILSNNKCKKLKLDIFKHSHYYDNYLEQMAEQMLKCDVTEEDIKFNKTKKTYYFVIKKESLNELKPIIKMFFYFIFSQNETYNMEYQNNRKDFIEDNKNLLIIIDRYSELDLELNLELKDLSKRGVKQILVSDLDKIDKSYFKIENENMKVTEKKMEYLYKVEENGNIDFYKDTCPVSKPKKISIEDELRMFKEL